MTERLLLFGDDRSSGAETAWSWISNQAWPGWRGVVLEAHPPEVPGRLSEAGADRPHPHMPKSPREAPAQSELEAIEHLVAEADPREVLETFEGASLIVIGPRGDDAWKTVGIGSTAEYLISGAPAPVVIAHASAAVERVLYCADASPDAAAAATALASMPWIGSCTVTALTVNPKLGHDQGEIERAAEEIASAGAKIERSAGEGRVATAVRDEAERVGADLIALGTRGRRGLRRVLLGSTASSVARHADCAVMVSSAVEPTAR